ncbi:CARDB domain-containing protein [Natrialbaceae archaeon AArc-T1-2]|uniref:CARDB domain-containing protein n=1 Tax=Natrialbaceae archaeon AArc-T1-2 TaxID=3053904 RepID=UPI00255B217E|nr:CARDB domain-containing protein [Natrialbaceae archaeon AArc-T1-2]WIV68349.1 CARDB domain-containing protein [Natrialbaceae archaeon AArc-T1-2]
MEGYDRRTFLGLAGGAAAVAGVSGQAIAQSRLQVAIQATNSPVAAGGQLRVSAEIWNLEYSPTTEQVTLEVGGEIVDRAWVSIPARGRAVADVGYETYPVRQDVSFPVTVAAGDDAATRTVEVYADEPPDPGALAVSITGTNDPVDAGEFLQVTATVRNTGDSQASGTARLLVGEDRDQVDSASVSLGAGGTSTVTLGYVTYPVRRDVSFPVIVATDDDEETRTVSVSGTG